MAMLLPRILRIFANGEKYHNITNPIMNFCISIRLIREIRGKKIAKLNQKINPNNSSIGLGLVNVIICDPFSTIMSEQVLRIGKV